jgi:hypothetical protein
VLISHQFDFMTAATCIALWGPGNHSAGNVSRFDEIAGAAGSSTSPRIQKRCLLHHTFTASLDVMANEDGLHCPGKKKFVEGSADYVQCGGALKRARKSPISAAPRCSRKGRALTEIAPALTGKTSWPMALNLIAEKLHHGPADFRQAK